MWKIRSSGHPRPSYKKPCDWSWSLKENDTIYIPWEKTSIYRFQIQILPNFSSISPSRTSPPSSTSPINTPIVTFHRDKRPANCTTKTRSSLWERLKEAGRDTATVEKEEEKVEGERREKRKRKPIVVAIKKEEKREREEFPSVAVDEQQPRLEGEGTVEMALGRGRRGWKRGYRGFILIPAGA